MDIHFLYVTLAKVHAKSSITNIWKFSRSKEQTRASLLECKTAEVHMCVLCGRHGD